MAPRLRERNRSRAERRVMIEDLEPVEAKSKDAGALPFHRA
jgi:hypothetical protein